MQEEISQLLVKIGDAWSRLDVAAVESLWDGNDPAPYLIAEEWPPCQDWDAIRAYFSAFPAMVYSFNIKFTLLGIKVIGEDMAYIHFIADWLTCTDAASAAMAGQNRGAALVRYCADGWRLCALVEAPLAPSFYLRWLAQKYAETIVVTSA